MLSDLSAVADVRAGVAAPEDGGVLPLLARAVAEYLHEAGPVARVPQVELRGGRERRDVLRKVERLLLTNDENESIIQALEKHMMHC